MKIRKLSMLKRYVIDNGMLVGTIVHRRGSRVWAAKVEASGAYVFATSYKQACAFVWNRGKVL